MAERHYLFPQKATFQMLDSSWKTPLVKIIAGEMTDF